MLTGRGPGADFALRYRSKVFPFARSSACAWSHPFHGDLAQLVRVGLPKARPRRCGSILWRSGSPPRERELVAADRRCPQSLVGLRDGIVAVARPDSQIDTSVVENRVQSSSNRPSRTRDINKLVYRFSWISLFCGSRQPAIPNGHCTDGLRPRRRHHWTDET